MKIIAMVDSKVHPKERGAFGPAEKYLRKGTSTEKQGMQERQEGPRTRGGNEERAPLIPQGSMPFKTVSEQLKRFIAGREKPPEGERR